MEYCFCRRKGQTVSVRICIRVRCRFKSAWPVNRPMSILKSVLHNIAGIRLQGKHWEKKLGSDCRFLDWYGSKRDVRMSESAVPWYCGLCACRRWSTSSSGRWAPQMPYSCACRPESTTLRWSETSQSGLVICLHTSCFKSTTRRRHWPQLWNFRHPRSQLPMITAPVCLSSYTDSHYHNWNLTVIRMVCSYLHY